MKKLKKLSRDDKRSIVAGANFPAYCLEGGGPGEGGCSAGQICSGGKCVPYENPGGGENPGGSGDTYTCICPWGTFTQSTPCPEFYCITG